MGAYAILAFLTAFVAAGGAVFFSGRLASRQFSTAGSFTVSTLVFAIIGVVLTGICSIIGILIAELVRTNF